MFEMVKSSIVLFFQGRLYAEPAKVYRQLAIGVAVAVLIFFGAVFAHTPVWGAAILAGFIAGILQPYLFKDLRFR